MNMGIESPQQLKAEEKKTYENRMTESQIRLRIEQLKNDEQGAINGMNTITERGGREEEKVGLQRAQVEARRRIDELERMLTSQ